MLRNRRVRRAAAIALILAGGILIWISPETFTGALLLFLGAGLEAVGIWVERSSGR